MIIDSHDCTIEINHALIVLRIEATVQLIEHNHPVDDSTFEFCVDYTYSGAFAGSGHLCVPVRGNTTEERDEGQGFFVTYTISNWDLTAHEVRCDLSVSARYAPLEIGPEYLIDHQHFAGPRPSSPHID